MHHVEEGGGIRQLLFSFNNTFHYSNSAVFCVVLIDDEFYKMFKRPHLSIHILSCSLLLGFKRTPRTAPPSPILNVNLVPFKTTKFIFFQPRILWIIESWGSFATSLLYRLLLHPFFVKASKFPFKAGYS